MFAPVLALALVFALVSASLVKTRLKGQDAYFFLNNTSGRVTILKRKATQISVLTQEL